MLSKSEIKRLNALKIKKYRSIHGQYIVEGPKILQDFLDAGIEPLEVFGISTFFRDNVLPKTTKLNEVSEEELAKVSSLMQPQGCLAVFSIPQYETKIPTSGWILAADNLQDPGNLGTLIRIADWFGIKDMVCSEDTVDVFNSKVVQATMGSLARVRVHYLDLGNWFSGIKNELPLYAGLLEGTDIREIKFGKKGILLIGNEGKGIRDELKKHITQAVNIPRLGGAESLNAGVAGGIMVSFALLQR